MLVYRDPIFLEHETGRHPENPDRLRRILALLDQQQWGKKCSNRTPRPALLDDLKRIHKADYVAAVREFAQRSGGRIETDTIVSGRSYDVAMLAAGAVCDAVGQVLTSEENHALCLVRPPGHHALPDSAMGFCLFNNVAIGARCAVTRYEVDRILIVDWDVHHGNGTQDAFWSDERVGFFSIHRWPFYPGTGAENETGAGPGLGTVLNVPLEFGTSRKDYHAAFTSALTELAGKMQPDLVLVSAGFDAHRLDPIGSLGLEVEDFVTLTKAVLEVAQEHCGGRMVSVLEGGYNLDVLPRCVAAHLETVIEDEARATQ